MDSGTYWFVISPISGVMTAAFALTYADGIWQSLLLGIAVLEALPLILFMMIFVIALVFSEII